MTMRRSGFFLGALVTITVSCFAFGTDKPSKARKFTLVYNVNNSGYIDVCGCKHKEVRQGSLTRRSSFLKQLRATGRQILLLDGGSAFFRIGSRVKDTERDEAVRMAKLIVKTYNRMGYRAMAVGPFDLAAGLDALLELQKNAKFQMLSANFADKKSGELYFKPHTILEIEGVRVGVIGLTLDTMTRPFLKKVAPNSKLLNPFKAARKSYDELREKTDLIVALSHLREETNFKLVAKLKGLEILIDPYIVYGNHRTWIKEEEWLDMKEGSLFLRGDGQGARLGVLDIELVKPRSQLRSGDRFDELQETNGLGKATKEDRDELTQLTGENLFRFTRVSIEPHHLTDPEVDHLIKEYKNGVDLEKIRKLEKKLPRKKDFTTHEKCKTCHEKQYAFWKTTSHSSAYATLKKTGDEHRYDCVGCHVLGYGQAFLDTSNIGNYADVQCESCHGNQPNHIEAPQKNRFGKVKRLTCVHCHNKDQTKKNFDFFRGRKLTGCPKS